MALTIGLSSFPVGRYVSFYLTIAGGVQIVQLQHGARDIEFAFPQAES